MAELCSPIFQHGCSARVIMPFTLLIITFIIILLTSDIKFKRRNTKLWIKNIIEDIQTEVRSQQEIHSNLLVVHLYK